MCSNQQIKPEDRSEICSYLIARITTKFTFILPAHIDIAGHTQWSEEALTEGVEWRQRLDTHL
jgi:hypothetical protein